MPTVYMYNFCLQNVYVGVNGTTSNQTIPMRGQSTGSNPEYAPKDPSQVPWSFSLDPATSEFGTNNTVQVYIGEVSGYPTTYSFPIPSTTSSSSNLVLHVYQGILILMDTEGRPVGDHDGAIYPSGSPAQAATASQPGNGFQDTDVANPQPTHTQELHMRKVYNKGSNSLTDADAAPAQAAASGGTSPGKVYIFNNVNDPIVGMIVNGGNIPATNGIVISAWGSDYAASEITVNRAQDGLTGDAVFIAGKTTTVSVNWQNFTGTFDITSPSTLDYNIQNDLVLLIAFGQAIMLDATGRVAKDISGNAQNVAFSLSQRN